MKVNEILFEEPLADYQHLSSEYRTPKELKDNKTIEKLKKWFNNIGYDIYAYTLYSMKESSGPSNILKNIDDGGEIPFYRETSKEILTQFIDREAAQRIKQTSNGITIIFVYGARKTREFNITPWGMVHDFVHSLDMGGTSMGGSNDHFYKLMQEIERWAFKYVDAHYSRILVKSKGAFYSDIGTTRSAKNRAFETRPEEFETELMTQYIVTGDVQFRIPDYIEDKERFRKDLNRIRKQCISTFDKTLKKASGRIYMTQI